MSAANGLYERLRGVLAFGMGSDHPALDGTTRGLHLAVATWLEERAVPYRKEAASFAHPTGPITAAAGRRAQICAGVLMAHAGLLRDWKPQPTGHEEEA